MIYGYSGMCSKIVNNVLLVIRASSSLAFESLRHENHVVVLVNLKIKTRTDTADWRS